MIKKLIRIKDKDVLKPTKIICLAWENKFGRVTLGGAYNLQEAIYDIYSYCFDECDGEPHFYEVTRGNIRTKFNCNIKNYMTALDKMVGEGYTVEDVDAFDRLM